MMEKVIKITDFEANKVNLICCDEDNVNANLVGLALANAYHGEEVIIDGRNVEVRDNGKLRLFLEMMNVEEKVEEEDEFDGILPGDLVT